MNKGQVFEFFRRLAEDNPAPATELEFSNPYTLLVAVALSAQATDVSVNIATRPLFARITKPAHMLALGEEALRQAIKSIGLFNTKARNVIALSQALIRDHGGEVPAPPRCPGGAARGRAQDRQCRPQHRLGRGDVRRRYPRVPGLQPHRPRTWQGPLGGRIETRADGAPTVPQRRPSLADPPRPLHVQGANPRMLALRGSRSLPVQTQDSGA